jgi:DNA-binding response OmpR family regulator
MEKILVIEDDLWISNSLKLYLENSDFEVELHHTWEKAIDKIKKENPNLIILDINLPYMNWMEICKLTREFSNTPIIMLTAKNSENYKITWLEMWADDYIAKPFSPRELLARIKRILKRSKWNDENQEDENILTYENIKLNLDKKTASVKWKNINLTKNEYDLLEKIIKENWKVVTRETLMTEVIWYDKYVYDRTLDTHIKNLRKKIWNSNVILTVRWEWYRLNK